MRAREIVELFTEVIIAPGATPEAIEMVAAKKNLRLLVTEGLADPRAGGTLVKSVSGGLLVQDRDAAVVDDLDLKVVTQRKAKRQGDGGSAVCLPRGQAREVQRDRLCAGWRDGGRRRRPDEPRGFRALSRRARPGMQPSPAGRPSR